MITLTPGKWRGLRRLANDGGRFQMTAVDQRPPIKNLIAERLGSAAPYDQVADFKALLVETLQGKSSALLLDPHYALPRALPTLDAARGLVVTLEDSVFSEDDGGGRLSASIDDWDVGKIKRMGGDAVKALVWYRPDAPAKICAAQQDYAREIGAQCQRCDIPFLLELLAYPLPDDAQQTKEYVEMSGKRTEHVLDAVAEFSKPEYAVDVFKLESPLNAAAVPEPGAAGSDEALKVFTELGRLAGRPWVMLSAGAGPADFVNVLSHACLAGASGYLAGRSIWLEALRCYPDWAAIRSMLQRDAVPYMDRLNRITEQHAVPWHSHACYGPGGAVPPADAQFRHDYATL